MFYNIYEYDYEANDFKGRFIGVAHNAEEYSDGEYYIEEVEGVPVGFDENEFLN